MFAPLPHAVQVMMDFNGMEIDTFNELNAIIRVLSTSDKCIRKHGDRLQILKIPLRLLLVNSIIYVYRILGQLGYRIHQYR